MTTTTIAPPLPAARSPLYKSLFVQVLVALLLGIVIGVLWPDFATGLKVLSDGFLKLITMIVAPIVFCVVVHGIAGAGDLKKVGRVGVKALVYFEVMTTVALVIGLILAFVFAPGHGMNIDPATLDAKAMGTYADNASKLKGGGVASFILNIIPTTSIDALARNDVLQVLFFAIILHQHDPDFISRPVSNRAGKPVGHSDRSGVRRDAPSRGRADRFGLAPGRGSIPRRLM
jgi:aerobic C4-dicarboxylate transport protein